MADVVGAPGPTRNPSTPGVAEDPRTTSEVVRDVVDDVRVLFRHELELAKLEVLEAVSARLQAAAAAAVGGLLALFALGFAGATVAHALEEVLEPWAAWLIVTAGFLLLAVIGLLIARSRATAVPMQPERTKRSIEENVAWAKRRLKR